VKSINGYTLDLDNPVTEAEEQTILGEIAANPIGCALSLKMIPAYSEDGPCIILIVQRDEWRFPVGVENRFDHRMPKYALAREYTSWEAVKRDLSNLRDVLAYIRTSSYREGRA
jgi:hypothetical protein